MTATTQSESIREKWLKQIAVLREEVASMTDGASRDAALRRIRQLENAAEMESLIRPIRASEA